MGAAWFRDDWNPYDGWGGLSKQSDDGPYRTALDAPKIVREWLDRDPKMTVLHQTQDLIIVMGWFPMGTGYVRAGLPYLTAFIWKE